jgi:predicted transcriptional regulator
MVGELVKRLFHGDAKALVAHLVSKHEIEADDLAALRRKVGRGAKQGRS